MNKEINKKGMILEMKNLSSWLLMIFMVMFWIFRVIVTFTSDYGNSFGGFIIFNKTMEIFLIFVTILCLILFYKRNIIGGLIYLFIYGYYFGSYILQSLLSEGPMNMVTMQNVIICVVAVLLAIFALIDLTVTKIKKGTPRDRKADWFYKNEQYDRNLDERADKNEYRNY